LVKDVRIVDSLDENTLSSLPSDEKLLKKLAEEIEADSDVEHLEAVFLKIMRYKNSPAIFRAIGTTLGPEKNVLVLRNVVAIFGKQYKKGSIGELQHLYPLVIEAQHASEERAKRAKAMRKQKTKSRRKKPKARTRV